MNYKLHIEQDEHGMFIGEIPGLSPCYSQASSLPVLFERMIEVAGGAEQFLQNIKQSKGFTSFSVSLDIQYATA